MRILITGGKGFIGSHCVEHFLENGDNILVIDHDRAGIYYTGGKYVSLDLAYDTEAMLEFVEAFMPETIIHLAAWSNVRESMNNPSKLYALNVQATANLVDILLGGDSVPVVFASSGAADNPESHYGVSKLACEHMLGIYGKQADVPVACLRFGNVYGERQNPRHGTLIAHSVERLFGGLPIEIYGDGTQQRDYIYVGDIVDAIEKCVHYGVQGVHNASTGRLSTTSQVVDSINATYRAVTGIGYPPPVLLEARKGDKQTVELKPSPVLVTHHLYPYTEWGHNRIRDQIIWRFKMQGSWDYPLHHKGQNIDPPPCNVQKVASLDEWFRLGGKL
jgi:UDP-glucose 4-epimerase